MCRRLERGCISPRFRNETPPCSLKVVRASSSPFSPAPPPPKNAPIDHRPQPWFPELIDFVINKVEQEHIKPPILDDGFSKKIFDRLSERLNFDALLTAEEYADIERQMNDTLDDVFRHRNVHYMSFVYARFQTRAAHRARIKVDELDKIFADPGQPHVRQVQLPDKSQLPRGMNALEQRWRDDVNRESARVLKRRNDPRSVQRELRDFYTGLEDQANTWKPIDAIDAFMDAYMTAIDPHSAFEPPQDAIDTKIQIRGYLFGIGAKLRWRYHPDGQGGYASYPEVVNPTPGGPAAKDSAFAPRGCHFSSR